MRPSHLAALSIQQGAMIKGLAEIQPPLFIENMRKLAQQAKDNDIPKVRDLIVKQDLSQLPNLHRGEAHIIEAELYQRLGQHSDEAAAWKCFILFAKPDRDEEKLLQDKWCGWAECSCVCNGRRCRSGGIVGSEHTPCTAPQAPPCLRTGRPHRPCNVARRL